MSPASEEHTGHNSCIDSFASTSEHCPVSGLRGSGCNHTGEKTRGSPQDLLRGNDPMWWKSLLSQGPASAFSKTAHWEPP